MISIIILPKENKNINHLFRVISYLARSESKTIIRKKPYVELSLLQWATSVTMLDISSIMIQRVVEIESLSLNTDPYAALIGQSLLLQWLHLL